MAITRRKRRNPEAFVSTAPDAGMVSDNHSPKRKKPRFVRKGKKIQITLTITQALLEQVDEMAERLSLSRSAVINLSIHQGMARGISVERDSRETS